MNEGITGASLAILSLFLRWLFPSVPRSIALSGVIAGCIVLLASLLMPQLNLTIPAILLFAIGCSFIGGSIYLTLSTPKIIANDRATVPAKGLALLRKYPSEIDKENLRTVFREISLIINDEVSPAQLEVHRSINVIGQKIGEPDTEAAIKRLEEIRLQFEKVRNSLIAKYVHGKDYADEAWDILENTDTLYREMIALAEYTEVAHGVRSGDVAKLVRLLGEPRRALENINGELGNWLGECIKRIRAKRDALDR